MRELKRLRIGSLILVLALLAAACGDDEPAPTAAPATTAAAPATTAAAPATTAASPATTEAAPATTEAAPVTTEAPMEPTVIRVRLNWTADPGFLGLYMADELGFFAEENVVPEFEYGGPNVPHPVQILAGGAADIGFGGLPIIAAAVAQGDEFVIFGTRLQEGILGISSLTSDPILTAADICGSKIGATPGDILSLDALLVINGLEPGCYDMVPVGFDPSPVAEGLVRGQVNYMNSHPVILDFMGVDNTAVSYADLGMQMYHDLAFVNRDFLDSNRDAVVGFLRAMVKGWEAAFDDPDTAIDLMMNKWGGAELGMDPDIQRPVHDAQVPLMTGSLTEEKGLFWMDYDLMATNMWEVLGLTGLENLPDPATMIDASVLDDAFGSCGPSLLNC